MIQDSRILIVAESDGVVEYVDANEIVVRYIRSDVEKFISFDDDVKKYVLPKYKKQTRILVLILSQLFQKVIRLRKDRFLQRVLVQKMENLHLVEI